jgi:hypothetical protein
MELIIAFVVEWQARHVAGGRVEEGGCKRGRGGREPLSGGCRLLSREDRMDRPRHPKVVRTWKVERTKVLYEPPRPAKVRPGPRRATPRPPKDEPQS